VCSSDLRIRRFFVITPARDAAAAIFPTVA